MDYDDNEFQGQSHHVGGEGSSKFSPVLHPYALSKFDFDDGLQGHLRFDSLVENEVFLGIPSQEDNQWIEDFSRGSGGIEFSSGAPEPCPSLRRNNVWSEAASSESVEMLLKSVGQEESISVVEESDACHGVGTVAEQMEPHLKEDDYVVDGTDSDLALLSEKVTDHGSRLIDVEGASNISEVEISVSGTAHTLTANASSEICDVDVANNNLNRKHGEEDLSEADTSLNIPPHSGTHDTSDSNVHTEDIESISENIILSAGGLDNQEPMGHSGTDIGLDSANGLLSDSVEAVEDGNVLNEEVHVDDKMFKGITFESTNENSKNLSCSLSDGEIVKLRPVEIDVSELDKSSSSILIESRDLQMAEVSLENVCTSQPDKGSVYENVDSSNMTTINQQVDGNIPETLPVVLQGAGDLVARSTEVRTNKDEISAGSELEFLPTAQGVDSLEEGKDLLQGSDRQLVSEALLSNDQASMLSNLENKVTDAEGGGSSISYVVEHSNLENKGTDAEGDGSSISYVVEHSSLIATCSRTPSQEGEHTIGKSKIDDAASGVCRDPSVADRVSPPITSAAIFSNLCSVCHDQDVSLNAKEKAVDSSEMECEISESFRLDKGLELPFEAESSKVKNESIRGTEEHEVAAMNAPDSAAEAPPLPYERDIHDDLAVDDMRENLKTEEAVSLEIDLISLKETLKSTGKIDPVLETEKGSSGNFTDQSSQETPDQSLPVVVNASGSEQTGVIMNVTAVQPPPVAENSNTSLQVGLEEEIHQSIESSSRKHNRLASVEAPDPNIPTPTVSSSMVLDESKDDLEKTAKSSLVNSVSHPANVEPSVKEAGQGDVAKDEKSFTFEVHLSAGIVEECDRDKQFLSITQASKSLEGASPLTPSIGPVKLKSAAEPSGGGSEAHLENAHGGSTGTPVRKRGRPSGKATGKQNVRKINTLKETSASKQTEKGDKFCSISSSLSGPGQLVKFEAVKLQEKFEHSSVAPYAGIPVAPPNLPDLNTSASPSASFRQPFTDLQQMQLRAQIFVYGSLIQGAVPDEACMVAAFGISDGGRSVWEPVWRAFTERLQGLNSNLNKCENQVQPPSGSTPMEQSTKNDPTQSSVLPSPFGRASTKGTPSPVVNSMIPLSSPLWNVSTPFHGLQSSGMPRSGLPDYRQTLSPSHPFQTPPTRNFAGHNTSWPTHATFPAPWVTASQSSPFDASARLPMTEAVKLTPAKESVPPVSSGAKHIYPTSAVHHLGPSVSAEAYPLPDMKLMSTPSGQKSAEPKSRKRKKSIATENLIQVPLLTQSRIESVPAPVVSSHLSTSVIVSTPPLFGPKGNEAKTIPTISPTYVADHTKRVDPQIEQKSKLREEMFNNSDEAKRLAADAAAVAAAAVSHSQTIWDQLDKQKSSGLIPEIEAKLASAAVAVAAAASVAKAAAAAAQIASNAASQAKMMADEAWNTSRGDNPAFHNAALLSNMGNSMGLAAASSFFNVGDEGNSSSSILFAAKEASRKRVEAASFASKRAENLDAIVKAAELAAAAVSQAGRIVAMGDPPSLVKLVEAGPEGYWKAPQIPSQLGNEERHKGGSIEEAPNVSGRDVNEGPSKKKAKTTSHEMSPLSRDVLKDSMDDYIRAVEDMPTFFTSSDKDKSAQRDFKASDLDKTAGIVPESENGSRPVPSTAQDDHQKAIETSKGNNSIKEGSLVEVNKEGNGFKEAWFPATVLSINNGKAFVSFAESRSGDGLPELKEWVSLEGDGNNAPRIRIARPVTNIQFEGTRKRRRTAMGDYVWSVRDKVDVWIQDCWVEGVVTEKNKIDGTTLTVHFPAEGETSVVRAWHLRRTLVWKDGEWIETSSSTQRDPSHQGDTPQEKRLKLGGPAVEGREKDNISKTFQLAGTGKPEELQLLPLATNEKLFNVGSTSQDDNKLDAPRTIRSGLQKEGPRVVFGVPKPGKKKKFMKVSKHYVAESISKPDKSKSNDLMPKTYAREKQPPELKGRVPKSGKPVSSFGRTLPQKDKFSSSSLPSKNETKNSASAVRSESEHRKGIESASVLNTDKAAEGSFVFSSSALSRNTFRSSARSERVRKGTRIPVMGKSSKGEVKGNIDAGNQVFEAVEPRRSNRRIQPTSRLLEGLQSSLVLPKFPSFAHDKGHRSRNRSASKGS